MAETKYILNMNVDRDVWSLFHKHMEAFWTPRDIVFTDRDYADWEALSGAERLFVESILSFFATADSIVNENLMLKLYEQIEAPAARAFYSFQGAMETIHGIVYINLLDGYVKDFNRLEELKKGSATSVADKIRWCSKWISTDMSLEERLIVFCCIEGVFFSGSFCAIYWLAQRGLLPALSNANKLIAPDEALHVEHTALQYAKSRNKVPEDKARSLFLEALEVENKFINKAIDCAMVGMNRDLMYEYIKHVSNNIFKMLGYSTPLFERTRNPFKFMERLCFDPKENFLEMRAFNYQQAVRDEYSEDADI